MKKISELAKDIPRVQLADLPTPLHGVPRLAEALGISGLLIKRDDQMRFALAGNKTRKLEFLLAEALEQNADVVITLGSIQSNHCSQTAAACAKLGMICEVVLGGEKPEHLSGNAMLDSLFGARIHWAGDDRVSVFESRTKELRTSGKNVYAIPIGGSTGLGALGYALAMEEVYEQLKQVRERVDSIFMGTSSGGTQAGMVAGAHMLGWNINIIGVNNDVYEGPDIYEDHLASIANNLSGLLGAEEGFSKDDFVVVNDYLGAGYGVVGREEGEVVQLAAETEGILFDPVYAVKALVALRDLAKRGELAQYGNILLWHTGGVPAIFSYGKDLMHE